MHHLPPTIVFLSSDTEGSNISAAAHAYVVSSKRQDVTPEGGSEASLGPNHRLCKERQPNWSRPKVMALINAKDKEHEAMKLNRDKRDLMQTASQKWIKAASDVSNAGFSVHK
jgi:hypothetical protein